jgi:hypothetical protein
VTSGFELAARTLLGSLAGDDSASSTGLARSAEGALEQLTAQLVSLLGAAGVQLIRKRSVLLASATYPWLAAAADSPSDLRIALEPHAAETITMAFVAILSAYVGLLERLIGEGIVQRLLDEIWPTLFTHAPKDSP